ncbi:MAG: pyridoxamine 5'-phosphate oxidase family protein [Planctomycetes bacterium]|nr:pyridoxamine 5'-phosphate oxidase family protein [Planctomycetota bacterium]
MALTGSILATLLIITAGCSQTTRSSVQQPEPTQPTETLNYDFIDRGATSQAEMEEVMGSVLAGYLIVNDELRRDRASEHRSDREGEPEGVARSEYPRSTPVNYLYRDKCFYFPLVTGAQPVIFKSLQANPKVFFAIDKYTQLYWWSANVFGIAEVIKDTAQVAKWLKEYEKALGKDGFNYPAQKDIANTVIVKITPETITGRKMTDPANPNYAARLPWMTPSRGPADDGAESRDLPVQVSGSTLAKEVSLDGVDPKVVESILKGVGACRLNIIDAEYPYSIPMSTMTYINGRVILHSNKKGQKMDLLRANPRVSLDFQWFWNNSNWIALNLEGHINILEKPEEMAKALGMGNPQMLDRMAQRMAVLEFVPEKISARQMEIIPRRWYPQMPGVKTR